MQANYALAQYETRKNHMHRWLVENATTADGTPVTYDLLARMEVSINRRQQPTEADFDLHAEYTRLRLLYYRQFTFSYKEPAAPEPFNIFAAAWATVTRRPLRVFLVLFWLVVGIAVYDALGFLLGANS
jgi:hypothetical protein